MSLSAAALAFTHRHLAPALLTLVMPSLLIGACAIRTIHWTFGKRTEGVSVPQARATLRRTTLFAALLSIAFVTWAIALDRYGGAYEHGHVAMFIAITVLGCIFCLGYHPQAASVVCIIVLGIFLTYCVINGSEVMIAIGINIALVAAVILMVLQDSFVAFIGLENSQQALERKRIEAQALSEENALLAQTDALTGLPNRRYFFAQLETLLADGRRPFAVGMLDLDGFKPINDTYGHAQGDRLLQIISRRLHGSEREDIVVTRLGGDEFGVLLILPPEEALACGQTLCDLVREPVALAGATVAVGCSMGLACFPEAGATAHDLFDRSDFALYHAKAQRRGDCVVFSAELEELVRSDQIVDRAFQAADLEQELSVVFQPIYETRQIALVGVEALARWNSPRVGAVSPEKLIAAAERTGMSRVTTLTLFQKALAGAAMLTSDIRLTFNLSAIDLTDDRTVTSLIDHMAKARFDPSRIVFELTENSLIEDLGTARSSLHRLKACGAKLALDDFGTGFSSLSSLHELPFDIVKIDRSFAARLNDATGRRLVGAIRKLAETLSLECVLEGIETERQLQEAAAAGFDYVQGYYLARPSTITDVIRNWTSESRAA